MNSVISFFQDSLYSLQNIGLSDIIDILVVAFVLYKIFRMVHSSSTARVAKAIIFMVVLALVTDVLKMHMLNFILARILELGIIALVILFQPELRRYLEHFGSKSLRELVTGSKLPKSEMEEAILATVSACEIMSRERVGVLLVFERDTSLEDYFKTGTQIDAKVSEQLLRNLFFPKAALHDGAVIVRGGRVAAAGCVMPLSENRHLSSDLGTRHRAAVGTSEISDAVVVVVSEETGTISVAVGGMLKRHLAPQMLERLLTAELVPAAEEQPSLFNRTKQIFAGKERPDENK